MSRVVAEFSAYLPGERVRLLVEADAGTLIVRRGSGVVGSWSVRGGQQVVEVEASEPGLYEAHLEPGQRGAFFAVLERLERAPTLAVVFHNHQAPNYSPDGSVREPWAYKHVWEDEFSPLYEGGAYYVQAKLLKEWELKWNANLSPSLLRQWAELLERGAVINSNGSYLCVEPTDELAAKVEETLKTFKELARGPLEVLTSFYSHPLAGYIAESLGWLNLLEGELKLGKSITERVLGVEPRGAWLPEMSFSMKLVPLMLAQGLSYTVLDGLHHFPGAVGDKESMYEPYSILGLAVFFRHTGFSDLWSFKYSNVRSVEEALAAAASLAGKLVVGAYYSHANPLTVALDGENWMILPQPKPAAAYFFDRLLAQLKAAEGRGLIKLVKLSEALGEVEPRKLVSIPPKCWMGGYDKWVKERAQVQEAIWANVVEAYEAYKALENSVSCSEEEKVAMMHAVNSDHIWAEFADEGFSREWTLALRGKLEQVLSSLRIEGFSDGVLRLRNGLGRSVRVLIREDGHVREVTLAPGLTEVRLDGKMAEILIKGWMREFRVGKLLVRRSRNTL